MKLFIDNLTVEDVLGIAEQLHTKKMGDMLFIEDNDIDLLVCNYGKTLGENEEDLFLEVRNAIVEGLLQEGYRKDTNSGTYQKFIEEV